MGAFAGAGLHKDLMSSRDKGDNTGRSKSDAIFVCFDFAWYDNDH